MALHRPSEGQLKLIEGTNDLAELADRCPIEVLTGQEPGCDCGIVLDCRCCQYLHHQRLRLPQHNAPRSHVGLKSTEAGAEILRKSFCKVQPMGQQNMGTVRAQDLSVSHIFERQ